jgi:hypothetical protein
MATTTAIYSGIADALEEITGLRVHENMPSSINELPCGVINPVSLDPLITMGGNIFKYEVQVVLFVGSVLTGQAYKTAQNYLDPTGSTSVVAKIDADDTLGGTVTAAFIRSSSIVQREIFGGVDVVSVEFLLEYWRT